MKSLKYFVLDVFTSLPYNGNQLSVVYEENELNLDQYHQISKEFGYSETSFVHYAAEESIFKVRSFTTANFEVAGAGHNLLGAVCLALINKWDIFKNQESPVVQIKDTIIPLRVTYESGIPYVGMMQSNAEVVGTVPVDELSEAIGLNAQDILESGIEVNIVRTEVPHLMVPVKNLNALKRATANKTKLKALSAQYNFEGFYLFTLNGLSENCLAETRFFNPGIGIDEDPATGTAAGPLAGYLASLSVVENDKDYVIVQGKYVEHPSNIRVRVEDDGIWVSGSSVIVMEGTLNL